MEIAEVGLRRGACLSRGVLRIAYIMLLVCWIAGSAFVYWLFTGTQHVLALGGVLVTAAVIVTLKDRAKARRPQP